MPVNCERIRADDEILNAESVELGKQISEVFVHHDRPTP
jgi:hypothetical protein